MMSSSVLSAVFSTSCMCWVSCAQARFAVWNTSFACCVQFCGLVVVAIVDIRSLRASRMLLVAKPMSSITPATSEYLTMYRLLSPAIAHLSRLDTARFAVVHRAVVHRAVGFSCQGRSATAVQDALDPVDHRGVVLLVGHVQVPVADQRHVEVAQLRDEVVERLAPVVHNEVELRARLPCPVHLEHPDGLHHGLVDLAEMLAGLLDRRRGVLHGLEINDVLVYHPNPTPFKVEVISRCHLMPRTRAGPGRRFTAPDATPLTSSPPPQACTRIPAGTPCLSPMAGISRCQKSHTGPEPPGMAGIPVMARAAVRPAIAPEPATPRPPTRERRRSRSAAAGC